MKRIFNFSAGPAMLPTEVLEKSGEALLDYQGKGFGIAEVSHRGKEFDGVADEAIALCKKLFNLGDTHDVLFMQGGATAALHDHPDELPARLGRLPRQRRVEQESGVVRQGNRSSGEDKRRRDERGEQFRSFAETGRVEDERECRLLPRVHERDRTWPSPAGALQISDVHGEGRSLSVIRFVRGIRVLRLKLLESSGSHNQVAIGGFPDFLANPVIRLESDGSSRARL